MGVTARWGWMVVVGMAAVVCSDIGVVHGQPASRPASRPVGVAPTSRPATQPKKKVQAVTRPAPRTVVVRVVPKPTTRPAPVRRKAPVRRATPKPRKVKVQLPRRPNPARRNVPVRRAVPKKVVPKKPALPPARLPKLKGPFVSGWLSFTLSKLDDIWLDGQHVGRGVIAYLRVLPGLHRVKLIHKKLGVLEIPVNVVANHHVVVMRKEHRVGTRQSRWERSNVSVRMYTAKGKPMEQVRTPGPYCIRKGVCPVLMPGDTLYVQADGRYTIEPSQMARKSAQPYRKKPGDGFLTLYSYPPGALFLNKKLVAMSPVARLPVRPGKYRIMVRNGYLNMMWSGWLVIRAGQEVRKVVLTTPKFRIGAPGKSANIVVRSKKPARIFLNGLYRGWTPLRVLPTAPGKHVVSLQFFDGSVFATRFELHAGQLEIIDGKFPSK